MSARIPSAFDPGSPLRDSARYVSDSSVALGACTCGTVRYAVDRPFETLSHYDHPSCGPQRRSGLTTLVAAPVVAFRWLSGEDSLTTYDSIAGTTRSFCRWCGSAMPVITRDVGVVLCPVSSLETSHRARAS
jgi:hypothetical protein